jgi:EmrB/QacA subfamily drug resistance transporter
MSSIDSSPPARSSTADHATSPQAPRGNGKQDAPRDRGGLRGHPWVSLLAVALGVMLVGVDGTIVAIASPAMQEHLHTGLAGIQWVTNSYLLALAVSLITVGKLGDRFGHVRFFLVGAAGFVLASAGIGLSHSIGVIIALRTAQGVFGAMVQPTAMGVIRATFPAERLNAAIGIWGATVAASTAAGPIIGGLLIEHASWQACFFVNVPVGVLAIGLSLAVLQETPRDTSTRSFDALGIALLSGTLASLVWGIIKAPAYGWGDSRTLAFLGGAVVLGALFVWRESRTAEPLLPLRLFRSAALSAGTVLVLMLAFAMFGVMFFMTFFLQNVHGLSPVSAGVHLLPMTGTLIVGAPLSSAALNRFGPRIPMVAGMALATASMLGMATMNAHSSPNDTVIWLVLLGLGLAPVMVAGTEVIVGNAPVELAGVASGLQSTAMQLGGSIGTAVLGALMAGKVDSLLPARWSAAGLPPLSGEQLAQAKEAVAVGMPPVAPGTPAQLAQTITGIAHHTFMDGLTTSLVVGGCVTAVGVLVGLLVKAGRKVEGGAVHI